MPDLNSVWNSITPKEIHTITKELRTFSMDPMDLPAAILYLSFDVIAAVTPVVFYYAFIHPIAQQWAAKYNETYLVSWKFLWIGNLVLYAAPALVGGFTWLWNPYLAAGYVAFTQYVVLWGGSVW